MMNHGLVGMAWDGMGMTCTAVQASSATSSCGVASLAEGWASVVAPLQVPVIKLGVIVVAR